MNNRHPQNACHPKHKHTHTHTECSDKHVSDWRNARGTLVRWAGSPRLVVHLICVQLNTNEVNNNHPKIHAIQNTNSQRMQ